MSLIQHRVVVSLGVALLTGTLAFAYLTNGPASSQRVDDQVGTVHEPAAKAGLLEAERLLKDGSQDQAISLLRALVRQYSQEPVVHLFLGVALLSEIKGSKEGKLEGLRLVNTATDEGLAHLRKATDLAPTKTEYRTTYALHLAERGRHKLAVAQFEQIFADGRIREHKKYRTLVVNYAEALVASGQYDRALDEYRKSLAVAPNDRLVNDSYQALLAQRRDGQ